MNKLRSIILAFTALTATVASAENMFATVLGKTEDETKEKIEKMLAPFNLGSMPEIPAAITVNRANQILNSF